MALHEGVEELESSGHSKVMVLSKEETTKEDQSAKCLFVLFSLGVVLLNWND